MFTCPWYLIPASITIYSPSFLFPNLIEKGSYKIQQSPSIYSPIHPPIHLAFHPSICSPVYQPVNLSIHFLHQECNCMLHYWVVSLSEWVHTWWVLVFLLLRRFSSPRGLRQPPLRVWSMWTAGDRTRCLHSPYSTFTGIDHCIHKDGT